MAAPHRAPRSAGYLRQLNIGDLELESGVTLPQVTIGYETWGTLNEAGDNAILILHALTGDTHVSRGVPTPDMPAPLIRAIESDGWWEGIVGPGSVVDTNRYFVIAPNILGGCYGSTGPSSIVPEGYPGAGEHWGSRFPQVSIRDSVRAEGAPGACPGCEQLPLRDWWFSRWCSRPGVGGN